MMMRPKGMSTRLAARDCWETGAKSPKPTVVTVAQMKYLWQRERGAGGGAPRSEEAEQWGRGVGAR